MRFILLLFCLQSLVLSAAPRVVTSIAPLQEVTATIMAGIARPDLIITDRASMHHFAFKPSHMRLLQQAELVVWIDRHFEAGFIRIADILPESTRQLELVPGLKLETNDGHIWYSPRLLVLCIELIVAELTRLDPANQQRYRSNASELITEVEIWRDDMRRRWQSDSPRALTDHSFLGHFAQDMGLVQITSIHDHHDAHGSLKDLHRIEKQLQQNPISCLLTLDSTPAPLAARLAAKYQLRTISITSVIDTNPERNAIMRRLDQLTASLDLCLTVDQKKP